MAETKELKKPMADTKSSTKQSNDSKGSGKPMDGDKDSKKQRVIEILNKARSMELFAIAQYMNQHYNLDDNDYGKLAANIKLIAIDEMRHAELFAERIKDLEGEPTTQMDRKPEKGQDVKNIFPFNQGVEDNTIDVYNQFMRECRELGDNVTARLIEQIIVEEQDHTNYFGDQAKHISKLGDTYLSTIAGTPSSTGGWSKGFSLQADEKAAE